MTHPFGSLIIGSPEHGVVIFARRIADTLGRSAPRQWVPDVDTVVRNGLNLGRLSMVHTHFTDQLFASRCEVSAAQFLRLVTAVFRHTGAGVAVTLHDIPYPNDDRARFQRRAAAYAAVIAACAGRVIVSSEHEATRVRAISPRCRPIVIPLPIASPQPATVATRADSDVTVLGFIYPGKGHAEAIQATRHLPDHVGITALGRPSDDHDALMTQLRELSTTIGRTLTVTGFVPEPEFTRRLQMAAIPLAAHIDISASGSIASWQEAGRRPLVPDGPYTRELEHRSPGSVRRYRPDEAGMAGALQTAWLDPASTWLAPTVLLTPTPAEVGRRLSDALLHFSRPSRR